MDDRQSTMDLRPSLSVRMPKRLLRMEFWRSRSRCGCAMGWLHQELIGDPAKVSTGDALMGLYELGFPDGSLGRLMKANDEEHDDGKRLEVFLAWCAEQGVEIVDS